jgi:hypothetical protein
MKFEMAATDASQNRTPQPGTTAETRSSRRPAPFAASLEVEPWIVTEFNVPIEIQELTPTTETNSFSLGVCA